jgi:NhaP-type Na+/H+ or K+/H+ antiporter
MNEHLLLSLATILVLGISAQWLAWRLRLPSILLLLLAGFAAGPLLGWIDPDALLGPWLMPIVSVSVGLILFEGGLTLQLRELKTIGATVRNLITVGALVTWLLSTLAAHLTLGWHWGLCTLMGAILVVTGPTVIMPLLRQVQPVKSVGSTLKWEGILIDPIGALMALLVYEVIVAQGRESISMVALAGFGKTVLVGGLIGVAAGYVLVFLFRRYWIPDYLQSPVSLMFVVAAFTVSNQIRHESGLLTVTLMGITLANQTRVQIRHIIEFKENLRVLLLSALFILLASRLKLDEIERLSLKGGLMFLGLLMLAVRPISVWLSVLRSPLNLKERVFLSCVAPRGIVAAAVASIFSLRLSESKFPQADQLVPVTFLIIVGTVAIYGLTAGPLAAWLELSKPNPQGALFLGANPLTIALAKALHEEGFQVLVADTNRSRLLEARMQSVPTYQGNILSEQARDELDLTGIGRLLAMTPNHEVNTLAALHCIEFFGRSEVYQVQVHPESEKKDKSETHGRIIFDRDVLLEDLLRRLSGGATIRKTKLTEEFDFNQWRDHHGKSALPLFLITEGAGLKVFTAEAPPSPVAGQTLVALGKGETANQRETSEAIGKA